MPELPSSAPRRVLIVVAAAVLCSTAVAMATLGAREKPPTIAGGSADSTALIAGGPFEPSGVAYVPGSNHVLFVDDGRTNEVFLMELGADGRQVGAAAPIALGADVRDLEGITSDGAHFYVVGSQSKKNGFDGDGLVRFSFDPASRRIQNVESIRGIKAWLAANVAELAGTANKIGDDVLNIEGLAWDPTNQRMLLGLRAPQVGGDALIIPVKLVDAKGAFAVGNLRVDGATIRLSLGGAGIRGLEYDAAQSVFHIIAGAGLDAENQDFQTYQWNGQPGDAPRRDRTFSRDLKPEGFTRATIHGRSVAVTVFDVGRFSTTTR